jgi:hypothetical protein
MLFLLLSTARPVPCDPNIKAALVLRAGDDCRPCYYPCVVCSGLASNECSTCLTGFFPSGSTCEPCSYGCQTCSSATVCNSCLDGFFGLANFCQACSTLGAARCNSQGIANSCVDGWFFSSSENSCTLCSDQGSCSSCSSATTCSNCVKGYALN